MDTVKPRKHRAFFQNMVIVLLTISAAVLLAQTQLYNLESSDSGYLSRLLSSTTSSGASGSTTLTDLNSLSAPVRIAVTGEYGRYANVSLSTTDEAFLPLRTLLGEALGSAKSFSACSKEDFHSALSGVCVYYDFLHPLPLSVLAALVGETPPDIQFSARYLVVFFDSQQINLCLWDGQQAYQLASTAVVPADLDNILGTYELTGAAFAFDNVELDPLYSNVSPYSLFPAELPRLPVLTASNPLSDTTQLLTALGFNPHTNNRYQESSGTEVILEGDQTLRIRPDGLVFYQSGSEPPLEIKSQSDTPTVNEVAVGTLSLLNSLLDGTSGDASLYLMGIQRSGHTTTLQFAYQLAGVPIRFSDGSCAAEVVLSGNAVTSLWIRFRQYTASGEDSLLLPVRQALAIAADHAGAELSIGYADDAESTVYATWLAE